MTVRFVESGPILALKGFQAMTVGANDLQVVGAIVSIIVVNMIYIQLAMMLSKKAAQLTSHRRLAQPTMPPLFRAADSVRTAAQTASAAIRLAASRVVLLYQSLVTNRANRSLIHTVNKRLKAGVF